MKARLLAALLPIFLSGVDAAPVAAQTLPEQLQRCFKVYGVMDRLACYDEVARGVAGNTATNRPAPPASPAMPANPVTAAAPPPQLNQAQPGFGYNPNAPSRQTTPQTFGSENIQRPAAPPTGTVDSITVAVTSYSFTPQGRFILTLANGQVWQQIEGDVGQPQLKTKHARNVTISRGLLGSYNLSFSDQTGRFKVNRTR